MLPIYSNHGFSAERERNLPVLSRPIEISWWQNPRYDTGHLIFRHCEVVEHHQKYLIGADLRAGRFNRLGCADPYRKDTGQIFSCFFFDRTVFWFGLVMVNLFLIISAAKIHMLPCMKHHEALSGSMVKVLHRSRILRLLLGCGSYRSSGDACRTSAWVLEGLGAVRCPEDLTMS